MNCPSNEGMEKRKFIRVRINLGIHYRVDKPVEVQMQVGNREISAYMLDLSEGGMAILTDSAIPRCAGLSIKFNATLKSGSSRTVTAVGEVRYAAELINNQFRLGVQFTSISEEDKKFIVFFINSLLPEG